MSTAATLTALGAVAMSGALSRLYDVGSDASPAREALSNEVVVFVAPAPLRTTPLERTLPRERAIRRSTIASRIVDVDSSRRSPVPPVNDAGTGVAGPLRAPTIDASASPVPAGGGGSPAASGRSFVVRSPSPFARAAALGAAERDSLLYQLTRAVPLLASTRRPTQAEMDSLLRLEARRQAMWREQGRPVPLVWGSIGVSLPLLSPGPSRAKRMRDSVVHQGNLERLQRITQRVQAARARSRAVDSLVLSRGAAVP